MQQKHSCSFTDICYSCSPFTLVAAALPLSGQMCSLPRTTELCFKFTNVGLSILKCFRLTLWTNSKSRTKTNPQIKQGKQKHITHLDPELNLSE